MLICVLQYNTVCSRCVEKKKQVCLASVCCQSRERLTVGGARRSEDVLVLQDRGLLPQSLVVARFHCLPQLVWHREAQACDGPGEEVAGANVILALRKHRRKSRHRPPRQRKCIQADFLAIWRHFVSEVILHHSRVRGACPVTTDCIATMS